MSQELTHLKDMLAVLLAMYKQAIENGPEKVITPLVNYSILSILMFLFSTPTPLMFLFLCFRISVLVSFW